jgi:hypothetical protein
MFAGATKLEVSRPAAFAFGGADILEGPATTAHGRTDAGLEQPQSRMARDGLSTHPTLLRAPDRARTCISVCIYDGQHIGGGVRCNIEPVGPLCQRASGSPLSGSIYKIISILKSGTIHLVI